MGREVSHEDQSSRPNKFSFIAPSRYNKINFKFGRMKRSHITLCLSCPAFSLWHRMLLVTISQLQNTVMMKSSFKKGKIRCLQQYHINSHLHCSKLKDNGRILRWEGGIGVATDMIWHSGILHTRGDVIQEFALAKSFITCLKHWKRNQEGLKSPVLFYDVVPLYQMEGTPVLLISTLLRQAAPSSPWCLTAGGAALCHHLHVHQPD